MTELERITSHRMRGIIWLTGGIILSFGFAFGANVFFKTQDEMAFSLLLVPMALNFIVLGVGARHIHLYQKGAAQTGVWEDELIKENSREAACRACLVTLPALPLMALLGEYLGWSLMMFSLGIASIMVIIVTCTLLRLEAEQNKGIKGDG